MPLYSIRHQLVDKLDLFLIQSPIGILVRNRRVSSNVNVVIALSIFSILFVMGFFPNIIIIYAFLIHQFRIGRRWLFLLSDLISCAKFRTTGTCSLPVLFLRFEAFDRAQFGGFFVPMLFRINMSISITDQIGCLVRPTGYTFLSLRFLPSMISNKGG